MKAHKDVDIRPNQEVNRAKAWYFAVFILMIFGLLYSCAAPPSKGFIEKKYGPESYKFLSKYKTIEKFQLDVFNNDSTAIQDGVDGYAFLGQPEELTNKSAQAVMDELLSYKRYWNDSLQWSCNFFPTYGLRISRKRQEGYILVSESCQQAKYWMEGDTAKYFIDYTLLTGKLDSLFNE